MRQVPSRIETGILSKVPPELLRHILKFLSPEDLVACSLVCKFLNFAASDESLWRWLYCMRWGLLLPTRKPRECAWKKLYIQRDAEDMMEFVRNTPKEFKEYCIQMQAAKRSQAPLPSQINDDRIILDKTVADQVSMWKKSKGLGDKVVIDHSCSGETCNYYQIGDVYVCEKTGHVHVCDDTCREVVPDPPNGLLVCTISGHCFERMLSPSEMEQDGEQQQGGTTDEAEPFMGSGRFGIYTVVSIFTFGCSSPFILSFFSFLLFQLELIYWDTTVMTRRNYDCPTGWDKINGTGRNGTKRSSHPSR
ncbi:F-box protein SKIP31 isoform X4 [Nicotiana tabacum]